MPVTSVFSLLGQGIPGNWSLYDEGGSAAVPFDTFYSIAVRSEGKVTTYPTEESGFFAYNKVASPTVANVVVGLSGSSSELSDLLEALDTLKTSTERVSIVTPERTFTDYSLESYDYQRTAQDGIDRLVVNLTLLEIVEVEQEYSNEALPVAESPKQASDTKTKSAGKQSANTASTNTEARVESKHNSFLSGLTS